MQAVARQTRTRARVVGTAVALVFVLLAIDGTQAHKTITSKYTYNDHVFPIVRDRCGRCHFEGGPTPMSLLSYKDAEPWAEAIREELIAESMPPWYVDPTGPATKGGYAISSRELDTLVTWATGGTPQGDPAQRLPALAAHSQWRLGPPDLTIAISEQTVPESTQEKMCELSVPTGLTESKWIKAVDLLPGTPSMVRDVTVTLENGPVLAAWVPGDDTIAAPSGTAFRLPAGATLHLRIHYKKRWQDEQQRRSDRSTIGLYFTSAPISGREIQALGIDVPAGRDDARAPRTFGASLPAAARVIAVRPTLDQRYASVDVQAVLPTGGRVPLLRLRAPRPEWRRRYWLADPVELPAGTRIEAIVAPAPTEPGGTPSRAVSQPLQVAVDFVAL